jgi:hypothetical protein
MSVEQGRFMRVLRSSSLTWLRVGSGCDILERKDQLTGSNRVDNATISSLVGASFAQPSGARTGLPPGSNDQKKTSSHESALYGP